MKISFSVQEVGACTLLTGRMGPDIINFKLTEDEARLIHGDNYENWQEAHITLQVGHNLGEEALKRLGVKDYEVINCNVRDE